MNNRDLILFGTTMLFNGAGAWTPRNIPNLLLWLDASKLTGADNDPIATWADQSGNGKDAVQASGTKQPLLKTNILNGLPGVLFDNSNDNLHIASFDLSALNQLTVFCVFTSGAGAATIAVEYGASFTDAGWWVLTRLATNKLEIVMSDNPVGSLTLFDTDGTLTTNPTITETFIDRTRAVNETWIYLNGLVSGTRGSNADTGNNFGNHALNIGSRNDGAAYPLNGYVFEIIIKAGLMTDLERWNTENYLNLKWYGIPLPVITQLAVSDLVDNDLTAQGVRSDGGSFIQASPFSRAIYTTDADRATIEFYNDYYDAFPLYTNIGVKIDGADFATIKQERLGTMRANISLGAGAGKTIEIIGGAQASPSGVVGNYLTGVSFNAPSSHPIEVTTPRILVYGDSIAVGAFASTPSLQGWVQLVRNSYAGSIIDEAYGSRSLNLDGATAGARQTFTDHIASSSPTVIWLAIGTNDYGLSPWTAANFGVAYADLLDKLHTALPTAVIYAQTPITRTVETERAAGYGTMGDYRAQIATAQSTRSAYCNLVDGTAWSITLGSDGIHPTTAGQSQYAAAVKTVLGLS